jgi:DNA mismatch repair protein MutS2
VKKEELQLLSLETPKAKPQKQAVSTKMAAPSVRGGMELDLRGQSGDEAIMELDRFLDNAIRLRLETVTVIHGKGTGVLRQRVQAHLKGHPQVKSHRLGVYGEGESGVTVVTLKK